METNGAVSATQPGSVDGPASCLVQQLTELVCSLGSRRVSKPALECARHALLDWTCVALAGMSEPAVQILLQVYFEKSRGALKLLPFDRQNGSLSVLINGAAGHALDYDDVNVRMHGHPSAPVIPAALAAAKLVQATGRDLLTAIVVGHEAAALIGEQYGGAHYSNGFHATGTIGTMGAAAAAARILGLSSVQTRHALNLAAAQAAGLKSMFGTMAKPLHAGKAAMNGFMAAQLAQAGFTAADDGIEGLQGFVATQCQGEREAPQVGSRWAIQDTLYKYHASCYLTHSTIEALKEILQQTSWPLADFQRIDIQVAPGHANVCNIWSPKTGLEIKFSLRHLSAMVMQGFDTTELAIYTNENALNPLLIRLREKIHVDFGTLKDENGARVILTDAQGGRYERYVNVGVPSEDLVGQWLNLQAKGRAITHQSMSPSQFDAFAQCVETLDQQTDLSSLYEAITQ